MVMGGVFVTGSGHLTIPGGVSIGTDLGFSVTAPTGYVIDPTTITWAGGTTVTNYLNGDPSQPAPKTQAAPTLAATDQSSYQFIVQAETPGGPGFNYDVTVTCKYSSVPANVQAGVQVSTDVAFTSVPPKVASLSIDHLAPKMFNGRYPDGTSTLTLLTADNGLRSGAGIAINATTQTSTTFGGTFMYLNLLTDSSDIVKGGGVMVSDPTIGSGANVDSGNPLAYEGFFWKQDANATEPITDHSFQDSPGLDPVSAAATNALIDRSYRTFLMFKPNTSGVWVALDVMTWKFAETITLSTPMKVVSSTTPTAVEDSAVGAWPTWTETSTDPNPASPSNNRFIPYNGPDPF